MATNHAGDASHASDANEAKLLLASAVPTPIALLDPNLPDQASRVVRGEVTVTWPYNSVRRSLAFLLADSDIRRRRTRGHVRVQLDGSAAQAVASTGLGGGDELVLSLDGAQWGRDDSVVQFPGSRLDWQLKFSEKLLLQVQSFALFLSFALFFLFVAIRLAL